LDFDLFFSTSTSGLLDELLCLCGLPPIAVQILCSTLAAVAEVAEMARILRQEKIYAVFIIFKLGVGRIAQNSRAASSRTLLR